MTAYLEKKLGKRKVLGNLRGLQVTPSLIDFSSNDTLGLARSPTFSKALFEEWKMHEWRMGSTGSRLLTGNCPYVQNLEERIASFHGYEAALIFSCGYMANVGLLSTVAHEESTVFFDSQIHASLHDGIRLSRAKAFPFRHNELNHLESRLKTTPRGRDRFICIESVYSTDGSEAPLSQLCRLAKHYGAHLIVDEAHATGVRGRKGEGLVDENRLSSQVFAQVTTFGKGLGCYGAAVLGSHTLKQALLNFATPFIYTTALPFHTLAAIKCSYDLFPSMHSERTHLKNLIQIFHNSYPESSLTHIQALPITENRACTQVSHMCAFFGFDVRPLLSPTVQRGRESLRICLHAFNTEEELRRLLDILSRESISCRG